MENSKQSTNCFQLKWYKQIIQKKVVWKVTRLIGLIEQAMHNFRFLTFKTVDKNSILLNFTRAWYGKFWKIHLHNSNQIKMIIQCKKIRLKSDLKRCYLSSQCIILIFETWITLDNNAILSNFTKSMMRKLLKNSLKCVEIWKTII